MNRYEQICLCPYEFIFLQLIISLYLCAVPPPGISVYICAYIMYAVHICVYLMISVYLCRKIHHCGVLDSARDVAAEIVYPASGCPSQPLDRGPACQSGDPSPWHT
jgi:hypothetical protein